MPCVFRVIDYNFYGGMTGERCQTRDLGNTDDLAGDKYVFASSPHQYFRFSDLRTTYADGAYLDLLQRPVGAFCCLGMRAH